MSSRFYPYATDSNEREKLAYYFAVLSVIVAYCVYLIFDKLRVQIPWWTALPSPMAIYLSVQWLFSNYLWRWTLLRRLGVVKIIDLNGVYLGDLWSSHDKHTESHRCEFTVTQTWVNIAIRGRFAESRSFNMVTGISVEGTDAPRLTYEYFNEPASGSVTSMGPHRGTIWFDIIQDESGIQLDGEYYTGRGRGTTGSIRVHSAQTTKGT
uniref:CD-NTase-associated protein 15 domain-containing protein n=1 Tax=mine drainage metagenome TaxID=410659 RepID=E6Q5P6_9ZZZZ